MTTGEFPTSHNILPEYHAIDDRIPLGQLPLAHCQELRAHAGDSEALTPDQRYELAWIDLEAAMAMTRETDPDTGQAFTAKQYNAAAEQVRSDFRAQYTDTSLPLLLRAKAGLALGSVDCYMGLATGKLGANLQAKTNAYLGQLQRSARLLLSEPIADAKTVGLTEVMASLAVLNEYLGGANFYLQTAPRQAWDIAKIHRKNGIMARFIITDGEALPSTIKIGRQAIGDELWREGEIYEPGSTLRQYLQLTPGFAAKTQKLYERTAIFNGIASRFKHFINEQKDVVVPPAPEVTVALGAAATAGEQEVGHPEIGWFTKQSSFLEDVPLQTLAINTANLEAVYITGELSASQTHALGWMQNDLGRLYLASAAKLHSQVAAMRKHAENIAAADRPAAYATADRLQQQADDEEARAFASLYKAVATMDAAARTPGINSADYYEIVLDAEAMPVYRDLFTGTEPAALQHTASQFVANIGSLTGAMRDAERTSRSHPVQHGAMLSAIVRTTFLLLVNGAVDESTRHLALGHSIRRGGSLGEVDAVVFPSNFIDGGYDTDTPVTVQFSADAGITVNRRHIVADLNLLMPVREPFALFAKLGRILAGRSKPTADLQRLALRFSNAIVDASEM